MPQLYPFHEIVEELIKKVGDICVFPENMPEIVASLPQQLDQGTDADRYDGGDELLAQMITVLRALPVCHAVTRRQQG